MNINKYTDQKDKFTTYMIREEKKDVQKPILPNSDSINFLVQIPHIYVYSMAYIETQAH